MLHLDPPHVNALRLDPPMSVPGPEGLESKPFHYLLFPETGERIFHFLSRLRIDSQSHRVWIH